MNHRPLSPLHRIMLALGVIPPLPSREPEQVSEKKDAPPSEGLAKLAESIEATRPRGLALSAEEANALAAAMAGPDPVEALRRCCERDTDGDWSPPVRPDLIIAHPPCVPLHPHSVAGRRVPRGFEDLETATIRRHGSDVVVKYAAEGFRTLADAADMARRAMDRMHAAGVPERYIPVIDDTDRHRDLDRKRFVYPQWEVDPPTTLRDTGYRFKPWEERELRPLLKRYNRAVRRMLKPGRRFNPDIYRDHDRIMALIAGDMPPPHIERLKEKAERADKNARRFKKCNRLCVLTVADGPKTWSRRKYAKYRRWVKASDRIAARIKKLTGAGTVEE